MIKNKLSFLFLLIVPISLFLTACQDDEGITPSNPTSDRDLTDIPYDPTPYTIPKPDHFPEIPIPVDNPQTAEGVELGRMLFYDPILSADSTMACASCHFPPGSFTDKLAVSTGIDGIAGTRSSMSLLNVAYFTNGLFWDGRTMTLEELALIPVEDPIELHNTWVNLIQQLKVHPVYPEKFRKAFGIENTSQITKELAAKAMAQFMRILISSGESKYDLFINDFQYEPTDSEFRGRDMFFDEGVPDGFPDAECSHCHNAPLFTVNEYFNNGLDSVGPALEDLNNFIDKGLGGVTGTLTDYGKFRAPPLRNITMTAPYMHDGRFWTLEEVLDHYDSGGKLSINKDPLIRPLGLTESQKQDIINFLKLLDDTEFINNPDVQNPF
jgi:cytochrome c peroxidase